MVGLERTVVPLLGEQEFGLTSRTAITSFIVTFGLTKAALNLVGARASDRIGRKPLLVAGWLLGLPVPFLSEGAATSLLAMLAREGKVRLCRVELRCA